MTRLLTAVALLLLWRQIRRLERWTSYKSEWARCGFERAPGRLCGSTLTLADLLTYGAEQQRDNREAGERG